MTGRRMSGRGAKGSGGSGGAKRRRPATQNRTSPPAGGGRKPARTQTSGGPAPRSTTRRGPAQGPPRRRQSEPRGLGGEQVEGRQAVRELLLAGRRRVRELYVVERSRDRGPAAPDEPVGPDGEDEVGATDDVVELARDLRVLVREVGRNKLASLARTEAPQGLVALAEPLEPVDLADLCAPGPQGGPPFLVALDGVTDPGNLGAVLRAAECAGVTGVVLPRHRAVHVTPTVAKAAAGAIEHLPMALVGGLPAALGELGKLGVWSIGLDAGGSLRVWDMTVADQPVVLVMGAEGSGLSRLVRQRCDELAAIPLAGNLASLNVATAAAVACFEVARHRQPPT